MRNSGSIGVHPKMRRHSCCHNQKPRKGLWSPDEDEKLLNHINRYGHGCWSSVPKQAGLQRCGKSCRLRWINYLRPDLKRGAFSQEEENLVIELHAVLGNRWSQIATHMPGRTDNEIKNFWHSSIKKKMKKRGIDPNSWKPVADVECSKNEATSCSNQLDSNSPHSTPPSGKLFADQFIADGGSSSGSNPTTGVFPSTQWSFPESQNPLLPCFGMGFEICCRTMSPEIPIMDDLKPMSGGSACESGILSVSHLMQDEEAQLLQVEGEANEEIKWRDYLNGAFPISAALGNQTEPAFGF